MVASSATTGQLDPPSFAHLSCVTCKAPKIYCKMKSGMRSRARGKNRGRDKMGGGSK